MLTVRLLVPRLQLSVLLTACGAAIAASNAGSVGDLSDQGDQDIQQSMLNNKLDNPDVFSCTTIVPSLISHGTSQIRVTKTFLD